MKRFFSVIGVVLSFEVYLSAASAQELIFESDVDGLEMTEIDSDAEWSVSEFFSPWSGVEEEEIMLRSSLRTSPPIMTAIDYHTRKLYLINYRNDKVITLDPSSIKGWPGDVPLQHTVVSASGKKILITTDSNDDVPGMVIELDLLKLHWQSGRAVVEVANIHKMVPAGSSSMFPPVRPVNKVQNVPDWTVPSIRQIHGPTLLPRSNMVYFTDWTSDQVRILDMSAGGTASFDPISYPGYTEQTHGVMFNESGTLGLGTGYFYDNSYIDLYRVARNGSISPIAKIQLGTESEYASYTHYVTWLDNRYALTASMQLDKTSRTPASVDSIIGPSVWLIDTWRKSARMVIENSDSVTGEGIFRSASDLVVAAGKLFVAEEDTLDYDIAQEGYISIYDMTNKNKPRFIRRLRPGVELPEDFAVAHTFAVTPNERFVYAASWASGYIVKINAANGNVVKIMGPEEGFVMPHGLFISGSNR